MSLDRRLLARIDRRLLSEMDHADTVQLVKVPVSDAVWSTWRRYCDAVGLSMGRGLAALLHHELASVIDEELVGLGEQLADREANVGAREAELAEVERALAKREADVAVRERQLAAGELPKRTPAETEIPSRLGRNDPCWCGSGKKFKVCHLSTNR